MLPLALANIGQKVAAWPMHRKVLFSAAVLVFLTELAFRRFAPRSRAYARWKKGFEAVGWFWTGIILSVVYFVSVAGVSAVMRLLGKDPLDRKLDREPTWWRRHDPNPLGPEAAARHQF
jgi:saxitoxin biosynthesis operon SxtJ-like protein